MEKCCIILQTFPLFLSSHISVGLFVCRFVCFHLCQLLLSYGQIFLVESRFSTLHVVLKNPFFNKPSQPTHKRRLPTNNSQVTHNSANERPEMTWFRWCPQSRPPATSVPPSSPPNSAQRKVQLIRLLRLI